MSDGEAEIRLANDSRPLPEEAAGEEPPTSDPPTSPVNQEKSASAPASASTSSSDNALGALGCLGFILFFAGILYVGFAENFRKDPRHTEVAKWEVFLVPAICLLVLIAIG